MRFFSSLLLTSLFIPSAALAQAGATGFQTDAPHAVIYDFNSQEVLFKKDAEKPMPPASMTKIMTALMVFEALKAGDITLDTEFPVSEEAWRRGGAKSGSSTMFLKLHSMVRVEDLLHGVITQSGNDACIVLAEGLAGSESAFAARMTSRAHELGMNSVNFVNSTGWPDPGHEISALDLAKLAEYTIREFPEYYKLYDIRDFTWNGIKQGNRNPLLGRFTGADGLKTGHTEISGYGLVGSAERDGERRIVVLNGTNSMAERRNTAITLMTAAFTQFKIYDVFNASERIAEVDVYMGKSSSVGVKTAEPVKIGLARINRSGLRSELHAKTAIAPIKAGDEIGKIVIYDGDTELKTVKAIAAEDVDELSGFGKAWASLLKTIRG